MHTWDLARIRHIATGTIHHENLEHSSRQTVHLPVDIMLHSCMGLFRIFLLLLHSSVLCNLIATRYNLALKLFSSTEPTKQTGTFVVSMQINADCPILAWS